MNIKHTTKLFEEFVSTIKALRDPQTGCPWDLEQTHQSLRPYLIEEAYEVLQAIETQNDLELCEELGDLLLQVVLHAQVAKDRAAFDINEVISVVNQKMIRRHPHVFGQTKVSSTEEVLQNWERIKSQETKTDAQPRSTLDGVPSAMPALLRAQRLGEKAANVNFDWDQISSVWNKVKEEVAELEVELATSTPNKFDLANKQRIGSELGDLLFSLAQLARKLDLSAEDSLHHCSTRFTERFQLMEKFSNTALNELNPEQLELLWKEAKQKLSSQK